MVNKKKACIAMMTLLIILAISSSIIAQVPPLPALYYGTAKFIKPNNEVIDAPIGITIVAKVNGMECGSITTTKPGLYGGSKGEDPKLMVQGNISNGDIVKFYVCGIEANEFSPFESGSVNEFNLTWYAPTPVVLDWSPTGRDVPITANVIVIFNESMNTSSVQDAFSISPSKTGTFSWDATNEKMIFNPSNLAYDTTYTITINTSAKNIFDVNLLEDFSWSFTTRGPEVPPNIPPVADANGPYEELVNEIITFDGSGSHDPDGYIVLYEWDWTNDGTWDWSGNSSTTTHFYTDDGKYTAKLRVTDDDGARGIDTATVTITEIVSKESSNETMDWINQTYGVAIKKPFYGNDTNNDGIVDTFDDPNGILSSVHNTTINGNASFLISTNGDETPEFIWDADGHKTIPVNNIEGEIIDADIDTENETVTLTMNVSKTGWVYISIPDTQPNLSILRIQTLDGRIISPERYWRENGTIHILDDPFTQYETIYRSVFDEIKPTISIINPSSGETVKDTVKVEVNGSDDIGIVKVDFYINDGLKHTDYVSPYEWNWDTTRYSDGDYAVKAITCDVGGNENSTSITIMVNNVEFPWTLTIGIIIAIAIVAIVIAYYYKKRAK